MVIIYGLHESLIVESVLSPNFEEGNTITNFLIQERVKLKNLSSDKIKKGQIHSS